MAPRAGDDYERREVMIPMRDGVKLFTVIVVPKGASRAPMIMTRTPYNAGRRAARNASPHMLATLPQGDEVFVADGYIRVFQDVRGKYGSEGDYVLTRPLRGPLNPTPTDHSTDAYDTIEWLVKNVPESNGRVGMLGSSYEGFTVVMALVNPHPALKVAAPMSPMVDGWMGDDWFHYGAFRVPSLDFIAGQTSVRGAGEGMRRGEYDDYEMYRRAGSAGAFAKAHGLDQFVGLAEAERAPGLRRVLAGPGSRPGDGRAAAVRADDVDPGLVGSGRHVGRHPDLAEGRAEGSHQRSQLPGDGAVAAQPGELRRQPRSARCSGTATPRCSSAATC